MTDEPLAKVHLKALFRDFGGSLLQVRQGVVHDDAKHLEQNAPQERKVAKATFASGSDATPHAPAILPVMPSRQKRLRLLLATVCSGVLLALAFPPLGCWPIAYGALVPLFLSSPPRRLSRRFFCGMLFGYVHFLFALWWLNSVGFGAGALLALVCAFFPALWYCLHGQLLWSAKPKEILSQATPEECSLARRPGVGLWVFPHHWQILRTALLSAAAWTALEWVRSWIFTGFPWDQLGISQAFAPTRALGTLAGPYGISFLIVVVNLLLAHVILHDKPWKSLTTLAVLFLCGYGWCLHERHVNQSLPLVETPLRITAIQADVPECREWTEEVLRYAWQRHAEPTRQAARTESSDLVVWPEGALPCVLTMPFYAQALQGLLREIQRPMLIGSLDERGGPLGDENNQYFNSAFYLTENCPVLLSQNAVRNNCYDKMHLVPFGEYVPFSGYFPWIADIIGMGRDLTPGKDYRLFQIPDANGEKLLCGVNICYEDVFPEISRRFTQGGAQLLMTITNDCWYGRSAGPWQHLAHAVFRALENRRPLLRSGNNSDTCLILPDGTISEPILGEDGTSFGHGWHTYAVYPVRKNAPTTLYARTGNLFAMICALATGFVWLLFVQSYFLRKAALQNRIG